MSRTESTMLELGTVLPNFELPVVPGTNLKGDLSRTGRKLISNYDLNEKPLLLMVICAHCPFVKHVEPELTRLANDYENEIHLLAISSNSVLTHPQDDCEGLALQAKQHGWTFPYLMDFDQTLAKSIKAACTPDFFLFSPFQEMQQVLRYRGQLDSSRPGNEIPVTGSDLRHALNAVLNNDSVSNKQVPSIGCNIKWHPGEEPLWFR